MEVADSIRKLGFRKWYERQLIESHAWLVSCFLGLILVGTSMELPAFPGGVPRILGSTLIAGIGWLLGWAAWRRYTRILFLAERLGKSATCRQCGKYAAFDVLAAGPERPPPGENEIDPAAIWLKVRCRKCGHPWTI